MTLMGRVHLARMPFNRTLFGELQMSVEPAPAWLTTTSGGLSKLAMNLLVATPSLAEHPLQSSLKSLMLSVCGRSLSFSGVRMVAATSSLALR